MPAVGSLWARRIGTALRRLVAARRGTIPVEMALVMPVLLVMLLGLLDVGTYLIMQYKLVRAAATVADLTARGESISEAQLADIFSAAGRVANPYDLAARGRVVVSGILNNGGGATIVWQRQSPHGIQVASHVGKQGGVPSLPADYKVGTGENIVVAESFFTFQPLVGIVIRGERNAYARVLQRPRLGTLDRVLP
jgi:Flp pilus assembly protein TadG